MSLTSAGADQRVHMGRTDGMAGDTVSHLINQLAGNSDPIVQRGQTVSSRLLACLLEPENGTNERTAKRILFN